MKIFDNCKLQIKTVHFLMASNIIEILPYIILVFAVIYGIITVLIQVGLSKKLKIEIHQPTVSILIAARNEENRLPKCLQSIANLDYPKNILEVLIIDDRSEDNTKDIAMDFCKHNAHFSVIGIKNFIPGLAGKMNALAYGIKQTRGEIIIITDADCKVPKNWVNNLVKYFEPKVGMCGGLTLLSNNEKSETLFSHLQTIDWIYLQAVASGSCHLGLPVSILGNNFAFRRKAYQDVGGFEKLGFSLTEDMALLQEIHKQKKWKIVYPLLEENMIYSFPNDTVKEFFQQRKRWILGGRKTHAWGFFIGFVSILSLLFFIISLVAGFWYFSLIFLLFMILMDASIIIRILFRINRCVWIIYLIHFKIFYSIYAIIFLTILLFGKKVQWKNINYQI